MIGNFLNGSINPNTQGITWGMIIAFFLILYLITKLSQRGGH